MKRWLIFVLLSLTFIFPSAGPNIGGTAVDDATVGQVAWTNPSNAQTENGVFATAVIVDPTPTSHYLKVTNFGFSIPAGSTITNILDEVKCKTTVVGDQASTGAVAVHSGTISGGSSIGSQIIPLTLTWVTVENGMYPPTPWTVAEMNDAASGMCFQAIGSEFENTVDVDAVRRTVTYTEGSGVKKRVIGYGSGRTMTEILQFTSSGQSYWSQQ